MNQNRTYNCKLPSNNEICYSYEKGPNASRISSVGPCNPNQYAFNCCNLEASEFNNICSLTAEEGPTFIQPTTHVIRKTPYIPPPAEIIVDPTEFVEEQPIPITIPIPPVGLPLIPGNIRNISNINSNQSLYFSSMCICLILIIFIIFYLFGNRNQDKKIIWT